MILDKHMVSVYVIVLRRGQEYFRFTSTYSLFTGGNWAKLGALDDL